MTLPLPRAADPGACETDLAALRIELAADEVEELTTQRDRSTDTTRAPSSLGD